MMSFRLLLQGPYAGVYLFVFFAIILIWRQKKIIFSSKAFMIEIISLGVLTVIISACLSFLITPMFTGLSGGDEPSYLQLRAAAAISLIVALIFATRVLFSLAHISVSVSKKTIHHIMTVLVVIFAFIVAIFLLILLQPSNLKYDLNFAITPGLLAIVLWMGVVFLRAFRTSPT